MSGPKTNATWGHISETGMFMTTKRSIISLLLAGLLVLHGSPAQAVSNEKRAAILLKKGKALLKKGNFKDAVLVLLKAQETAPSPFIKLEIAAAYEGLNGLVEAARRYEELNANPSLFGKAKDRCKKRLAVLREKLGRLTIITKMDDVEVEVNGEEAGTTPLPFPVYVEPDDEIKVMLRTPARTVNKTVAVSAGQHKKLTFSMKRKRKRARAITAPTTRTRRRTTTSPTKTAASAKQHKKSSGNGFPPDLLGRRWTWVAAGGAVIFGIVGMGVGLSAFTDWNEYKKPTTPSSSWQEMEDSISAKSTAANVMYGFAGGCLVAAAVLYFVESPKEQSRSTRAGLQWVTAGPVAHGDGVQVGLGASF